MIVLLILAIAGGLVAVTFKAAVDSRNVSVARIDVMEKGRATLDLMAREFQSAFINELGYLVNSFDGSGSFGSSPCPDIRPDPGTGGYPPPPDPDPSRWFAYSEYYPREIVGNGLDDDKDGLIDEVQMRFTGKPGDRVNGLDDDGDGLIDEDGALPNPGIDDDGDGRVDEDGPYPADTVNFAISRSRAEERLYDIAEVGYAIGVQLVEGDHSTRILRRFDGIASDAAGADLIPVDGQFLLDDPFARDADETAFTIYFVTGDPEHNVDILGFDTVGLRFTYWYYNYAVAQELEPYGGDRSRFSGSGYVAINNDGDLAFDEETINGLDDDGDGRVDEDPSPYDPSVWDGPWQRVLTWESSVERYPNEAEDINIDAVATTGLCDPVRLRAIEHMDGLPDLVEIELWVFDQERHELSPRHLSARVQIPHR